MLSHFPGWGKTGWGVLIKRLSVKLTTNKTKSSNLIKVSNQLYLLFGLINMNS